MLLASRRFCETSLRQHRIARTSVLFAVAACVHTGKTPTSSAESTGSGKHPNGENVPERFDLVKKWASFDGADFFKCRILTKDTDNEVEKPDGDGFFFEGLIKSKVFGLTSKDTPPSVDSDVHEPQRSGFLAMARTFAKLSMGDIETKEKMIEELVVQARESTGKGDFSESQSFCEILSIITNDVQEVRNSLDNSFGHLDLSGLFPTSLFYYLEVEDERKNPSWKRRMHRFHKGIDINQVSHLNNMLYLSSLSYADTIDEIVKGCKLAVDPLELVYCDTSSTPTKPGHFIALKKNQSIWSSDLEVFLVVRGTKTITDVMTDCVVDAVPYRGGKAHSGILQSGKWLVSEHLELLEKLRTLAGKRRIKLTLVGHSLGAGAASIAGIEFDDMDTFSVRVIGFGCPSLLSAELAKKYESQITTVIADSDVVPRMSAATVANVVLDVMEYDWTPSARRDIAHALGEARAAYPYLLSEANSESLMTLVDSMLETYIKPTIQKPTTARVQPELCPPGTCVHLYQDGSGIAGCIAPGTFFQEIDITRRMADDHKIATGYEKYFLELMRQYTKDHNFRFDDETRRLIAVD